MNFFQRLFTLFRAEAHNTVSKLEDPIKMTEQGIRDLKGNLEKSLHQLAEVKALTISLRRQAEENLQTASEFERKAVLLLQKSQRGELAVEEADRLASEALNRKEQALVSANRLHQDIQRQEALTTNLEAQIQRMRSQITTWEQEATTLKARAKVATASKKINQQLANIDNNSTVALLERMRDKVNEEEALAGAYEQVGQLTTSLDQEIDQALTTSGNSSAALEDLKARMGMLPGSPTIQALPSQSSARTQDA